MFFLARCVGEGAVPGGRAAKQKAPRCFFAAWPACARDSQATRSKQKIHKRRAAAQPKNAQQKKALLPGQVYILTHPGSRLGPSRGLKLYTRHFANLEQPPVGGAAVCLKMLLTVRILITCPQQEQDSGLVLMMAGLLPLQYSLRKAT